MASGGRRIGAGRKPGSKNKEAEVVKISAQLKAGDMTPLAYMLSVINDPNAPYTRRDSMAVMAAPYVHAKPGITTGKKEEREVAAKKAASGKFAAPAGPTLLSRKSK